MNKNLSAASIRNMKAYVSSILSEAVEDELIKANPAASTGKLIKKTDPAKKSQSAYLGRKKYTGGDPQSPLFGILFVLPHHVADRPSSGRNYRSETGNLDFNSSSTEIKRNCVRDLIGTPKSDRV